MAFLFHPITDPLGAHACGMLLPFASLLTFPVDSTDPSTNANSVLPPPSAHVVCTTAYPAPSGFLAWHYARHALAAHGGHVVWIGCGGVGERHVRATLRRALVSGGSAGGGEGAKERQAEAAARRLVYLDALDTLTSIPSFDRDDDDAAAGPSSSSSSAPLSDHPGHDARPALLRLQHRLEQVLGRIRGGEEEASGDEENDQTAAQAARAPRRRRPILVVLDDVSALSWCIENLSTTESATSDAGSHHDEPDVQDPRIKVLRDKRRQGGTAVHRDETGHRLGAFIEEQLRVETCDPVCSDVLDGIRTRRAAQVLIMPLFFGSMARSC